MTKHSTSLAASWWNAVAPPFSTSTLEDAMFRSDRGCLGAFPWMQFQLSIKGLSSWCSLGCHKYKCVYIYVYSDFIETFQITPYDQSILNNGYHGILLDLIRNHPTLNAVFSEAVWILLLIAWWVFSWSCKEAATKLGKFHLVETCINIYTCMGLCILDRMLFGSQDHLPQQKIMYNNHPPEAWQYKSASDKMASERATAWVDWIVLGLVADSSFFSNCNHWHIMLSDLSHKVRVVVFSGGPFRSSHIHVRFHHLTTYMQGGQSSTKNARPLI